MNYNKWTKKLIWFPDKIIIYVVYVRVKLWISYGSMIIVAGVDIGCTSSRVPLPVVSFDCSS